MTKNETLPLSKKIDIAMIKMDLVQADVVKLLKENEISMNTSKFSIKKQSNAFTEEEIKVLNKVLNTKL